MEMVKQRRERASEPLQCLGAESGCRHCGTGKLVISGKHQRALCSDLGPHCYDANENGCRCDEEEAVVLSATLLGGVFVLFLFRFSFCYVIV